MNSAKGSVEKTCWNEARSLAFELLLLYFSGVQPARQADNAAGVVLQIEWTL